MYDLTCTKCGRQHKSKDFNRELCPKCIEVEGFKKPKAPPKKNKKQRLSLDDKLAELRAYNEETGQCLTYGQYMALRG